MTSYLDFNGLSYFKTKMDTENGTVFVKNESIDSIIDNKLMNVYTYKGSVNSVEELPKIDNKVGDVYDVANGMNYAWNGMEWDALGENKIIVDAFLSTTSVNPVQNKVIKTELDKKAGTSLASEGSNGLMSSTDKQKLDGISSIQNDIIDTLFI